MAAIFATEYALTQVLQHLGVKPYAVVGHSLGEYVAAHLAGVLTLDDALALVALRGRLCDANPPSLLLSVWLSESAVKPRLGSQVAIAAINGPEHVVVSGPHAAVATLEAELNAAGIETRRLAVAVAAHSPLMEPLAPLLAKRAATMQLSAPQLPMLSNLTGTWLTAADASDPGYWARHLRHTVRFADSLATLLADPAVVLVEVGPGKSLATLAALHPLATAERLVLATMSSAGAQRSDVESLHAAIGRLWCAGVPVRLEGLSGGQRRRRVPLPTYPFEHSRYLFTMTPAERVPAKAAGPVPPAASSSGASPAPAAVNIPANPVALPVPRAPEAAQEKSVDESAGQVLQALWRELLGVEAPTPTDNFFDLGGSSGTRIIYGAPVGCCKSAVGAGLRCALRTHLRGSSLYRDRIV